MESSKINLRPTLSAFSLTFLFFFSLFLIACNSSKTLSPAEQALQIRLSINSNNVESFRALSSLPLTIRNQEWESAQDGYGFVLGAAKITVISTNDVFNKTIPSFLKSVQIEGDQATTDITLAMLTSQLGPTIKNWAKLNLIAFKRGEGDVEHIVVMGLNKKTNKLDAIYLN